MTERTHIIETDSETWWETFPPSDDPESQELPEPVLTGVHGRKKRLSEEADDYPNVVFHLNDTWRVIRCRDGIQWILQRQLGGRWRSQSYCRTRDGLLRCIREAAIEIDGSAVPSLEALPDRI